MERHTQFKTFMGHYGTALAGLVVFIFFSVAADNFLSVFNILTVLKQISYLTILAVGFSFALTTSELDLSFANVCSLCMVITGGLIYHKAPVVLAVAAGIGAGALAGALNGVIVTRLAVPSLIATLGVSTIANGIAFWITDGVAYVGRWPKPFLFLGRGKIFGLPVLVLWMLAIVGLSLFVLKKTRLGLHMIFTGEAAEAARLSGISVKTMKWIGLTLSGCCAGITAVLLTASLSSASPAGGADFMMTTMAAVLLGMTMVEPGRPNMAGSFIGALIIGILSNGLVLMGAPYYVQDIVLGLIIIGSVSLSARTLTRAAFNV